MSSLAVHMHVINFWLRYICVLKLINDTKLYLPAITLLAGADLDGGRVIKKIDKKINIYLHIHVIR